MRALLALGIAALMAAACAGSPIASSSPSAKGGATSARTNLPSPTGAKGGSPSPIPGVPAPFVGCAAKPTGGPMVLIGQAIYDVSDPVHPKLLCRVNNTVTHLFTQDTFTYIRRSGDEGTEVVLHSMGSGNESVIAGWPIKLLGSAFGDVGAWTPDGDHAATAVSAKDDAGDQAIQIWLFAQPSKILLYSFSQPLTDCICRFGVARPTLAFSADGQYLVSGWPVGKGASPLRVYRVADATLAQTLDLGDVEAIWSRTGHHLYLTGLAGKSRSWTPEDGFAPLDGATAWPYRLGLSPDGSQVAYTAYLDPSTQADLRVYVYDIATHQTRLLTSQMRSEVIFVKDGWVWYLEEAKCDPALPSCAPWGTAPTGKVFAMNLSTGVEQPVTFRMDETVTSPLSPGEFWPNS
ncbi:MAG: hypothetical protein E6J28_13890 [Chloroflexi bacterium]|nr:MAG: hypothetical protein E6J28_13890 [Chloroflexota bacterium]